MRVTPEQKDYFEEYEEVDPELFIRTNETYPKQYDPVNPTHYQIGGVETIDFIEAKLTPEEFKGCCKGNSIKYLSRTGHKGEERDDYKKAAWYLDRLLEIVQKS